MTALPAASNFTASTVTEGDQKAFIDNLRLFLVGLFGADGTVATALATLGTLGGTYLARTGAYTVQIADRGRTIDATTGSWTLNLPAVAASGAGFSLMLRNSGAGTITVDPSGAEQVDGATTIAVAPGRAAILTCTGTAWVTHWLVGVPFSATAPGLAPLSGGGTLTYLRADGTWVAPVTDGDKGDVAVSSAGAVWTIDPGAVTLSKMANLAASTILGNNTAAGATPIALTAAQVKAMLAITSGDVAGLGALAVLSTVNLSTQATGVLQAAQEPAHSGDVTNAAGSLVLSIAAGAVSLSKMANLTASTILGNNTGAPATPIGLTAAQVKTLLAIASTDVSGLGSLATASSVSLSTQATGVLQAAQEPAHTGDVTNAAGSLVTTIAALAVNAGKLAANAVTNPKLAQMAAMTVKANATSATADPQDVALDMTFMVTSAQKEKCKWATTGPIALATNGLAAVDGGVALVAGERILVKDQTSTLENGIYIAALTAWVRATDNDTTAKMVAATVSVWRGGTNGGIQWATAFKSPNVVGTDPVLFYRQLRTDDYASVAVTGGTIDGAAIGTVTPAPVKGSSLTSTSVITDGSNAIGVAAPGALAFGSKGVVSVTPNATGSFTSTVPPFGTRCNLIITTSGTISFTLTFGAGFVTQATLATGIVSGKKFVMAFISDGISLVEESRTVAM